MNSKIFGSRSFNSNITRSDHKAVIAKIQIKLTYTKKATGTRSFDLSKTAKYTSSRKLHETSKRNNKKSNKYRIKPGRMEQYCKNTKSISC